MYMQNKNDSVVQKYVSLLTNAGFKAVFGDRENRDVVISVINALLPEGKQVEDIEYLPTEHQGKLLSNKEFHFDFMCKGTDGSVFIVEMQCYPDDYWFKRCVSYASRAYDRQNNRGDDYNVAPVYLIGLMGTEIVHAEPEKWMNKYVSEYTFREKETNELQDETIFIIFAELARFNKELCDCTNDLERMLYVIKNCWRLQNQPVELQKEIFSRIFKACEIAQFDEVKRINYEQEMYDERRLNGELFTARRLGREEGLEQGRAEGLEEGLDRGREEAMLESARKFKELGVSVDVIAQATGLSIEVIEGLK